MSMDIFRADALAGKSILVTGGGSGLGKEISKALVAKGAAVHICGRRAQLLDEAVREISASGSAPVRAHGMRSSRSKGIGLPVVSLRPNRSGVS